MEGILDIRVKTSEGNFESIGFLGDIPFTLGKDSWREYRAVSTQKNPDYYYQEKDIPSLPCSVSEVSCTIGLDTTSGQINPNLYRSAGIARIRFSGGVGTNKEKTIVARAYGIKPEVDIPCMITEIHRGFKI